VRIVAVENSSVVWECGHACDFVSIA
jgi:hypothetical protein